VVQWDKADTKSRHKGAVASDLELSRTCAPRSLHFLSNKCRVFKFVCLLSRKRHQHQTLRTHLRFARVERPAGRDPLKELPCSASMLQRNNTTLSSHTRLGSFYYCPRTRQSKMSQYFISQKVMVFSTTAPSVRLYGPQRQIHRITAACMKNCSYLSCRRFDTASGTVPLSPFPATKSVLQEQEGPGAMLNTSISYRHLQWLPFVHEIWHSEEADRQGTGQVVLVQQKGSAAHGTD
jgi:hypothetical protein